MTATLSEDGSTAQGQVRWTIHNEGSEALERVALFLYPEIYASEPQLDDLLEPRVYPRGFNPGGQSLDCEHSLEQQEGVAVATLELPTPLVTGATTTLTCGFTTRIPLKFGSFGRYRSQVTLNGGLHPHPVQRDARGAAIPAAGPAAVVHDIELTAPGWDLVVGSRILAPLEPSLVPEARGPDAGGEQAWTTVVASRSVQRQNLPLEGGRSLTFVGRPLKVRQKQWIRAAANGAISVLEERGLDSDGRGLVLIEAPLRRRLVEPGSDGVILVSDRFLEMSEAFWRYHDLRLARAILSDGLRQRVRGSEEPKLAPLTLHGLSWQLMPSYLRARWKNHIGLERLLNRLSFLPQVDSLLQAPVFPFADQLFDSPWVADPLRADITRFNRPLRSGRTLFSSLSDRVGERSLQATVDAWLEGAAPTAAFYPLLEQRTGIPCQAVALSWLEAPPDRNLRLLSVERSREDDGSHLTRIRAERQSSSDEPDDRPVEVLVRSARPGRKGRIWLRWEGAAQVASWEVRTAGRTGAVQLDPRGRLLELDEDGISVKRDNRLPRAVKVTGYGYFIALDTAGAGLEAYGALNFRPAHDNRNHFLAQIFTDPEIRAGAGLSYVHYFGKQRIGSFRRHRIVGSWDFSWLNTQFRPTDAPLLTELRATYLYENRTNFLAPTRGQRVTLSAFGGKDIALQGDGERSLQESGYLGIDASAVVILRLHSWHSLALRAKAGIVLGSVTHRQLTLGGSSGLRGVPVEHLRGRFRTSATAEWRHFFVKDLDVPIPLIRVRGVQGSLFVEAGTVASDLEAGPSLEQSAVSFGYGLRFFGDWLGVLPAVGGIEVAWSPHSPPGRIPLLGLSVDRWPQVPVQIYIVGSQSF